MEYIYSQFVARGIAQPDEIAGGIHCMSASFLREGIDRSLQNAGVTTLDLYLLQNPETQLAFVDRTTFRKRLQAAFEELETEVAAGRIGCYGVSTWDGLRRMPMAADYLSLEILLRLAAEVAGPDHHLRAVQVPVNAQLTQAAVFRNQSVGKALAPVLAAAARFNLALFASSGLMQAQFVRVSLALAQTFPDLPGTPQRALQFARSLTGVTTALVGSTNAEHMQADLAVARVAPEPARADELVRLLPR